MTEETKDRREEYESQTQEQLAAELEARELAVSGTKDEQVARLLEEDAVVERYHATTVDDLKEALAARNLDINGSKGELFDRLLDAEANPDAPEEEDASTQPVYPTDGGDPDEPVAANDPLGTDIPVSGPVEVANPTQVAVGEPVDARD